MLKPSKIKGKVIALLINPDREKTLESGRVNSVELDYGGFIGETHSGLTRLSCSRVKSQYKRGTEIRNVRQISVLSAEEMTEIAKKMDIPELKPEWVGANLILSGVPQLSCLPPSSRLIFNQGTSIVIDMENAPCRFPGEVIDRFHPGKGKKFPKAAINKRGVTAWVERPGVISVGDECVLHLPPQRIYAPGID